MPGESGSSFFHENRPWDNNVRLFVLKIGWDIARAFLTEAALTVSLLAFFLPSSGNGNQDINSPFCHCGHFSSFTVLMIQFFEWSNRCCPQTYYQPTVLYSPTFCAALVQTATKINSSIIARVGGEEVPGSKVPWPARSIKQLIWAFALKSCQMPDTEQLSPKYFFFHHLSSVYSIEVILLCVFVSEHTLYVHLKIILLQLTLADNSM